MKTTKTFKKIALCGILSVVAIGGYQAINTSDSIDLSKLVTISNAYALDAPVEGTITCGSAGSGCKFTLVVDGTSTPMTSSTHNPPKAATIEE